MNRTLSVLSLALLLGVSGCRSNDSSNASTSSTTSSSDSVACICGEPAADLYGCHATACVEGVGNPDNANCACSALVATGPKSTAVSFGGAASSRELGRPQNLMLADGSYVRGILRSDDGLSIRLQLSNGTEQTLTYDQLAPRSVYRLLKGRVSKDDGEGLMELGNYTRDHGLYAYSKRHYQEALRADPQLKDQLEEEVAKLRDIASSDLLRRAQEALREGDVREAEKQLSRILTELPDEPSAETARAIMGDLAAQAEATRVASERDSSTDGSEIQKLLKGPQRRYERAVEENRKGMLASAGSSRATKHFEKAVSEGGRGRQQVETVLKKKSDMTGMLEAAGSLDNKLKDVMVTANLNLAGISMSRSSFNKATDQVNQALLLEPNNADAHSLKARIQDASARSGIGNGWGGWYLGTGAGLRGARAR